MREAVLRYLGYQTGATVDALTDKLINSALHELLTIAEFRYTYAFYDTPQPFMLAHPAYSDYLAGSEGYLLCACTLGIGVDRRLKRLQMEEMAYAVVFDAAAGAFVERKADEFEKNLPYKALGFRFCPGYQGTPLSDNKEIARLAKAEQIGISFLNSGLMLPMKSMTGIVRIGGNTRKSCANCVAKGACSWLSRGERCYIQ